MDERVSRGDEHRIVHGTRTREAHLRSRAHRAAARRHPTDVERVSIRISRRDVCHEHRVAVQRQQAGVVQVLQRNRRRGPPPARLPHQNRSVALTEGGRHHHGELAVHLHEGAGTHRAPDEGTWHLDRRDGSPAIGAELCRAQYGPCLSCGILRRPEHGDGTFRSGDGARCSPTRECRGHRDAPHGPVGADAVTGGERPWHRVHLGAPASDQDRARPGVNDLRVLDEHRPARRHAQRVRRGPRYRPAGVASGPLRTRRLERGCSDQDGCAPRDERSHPRPPRG